ncbi:uncharacterized protein LOC115328245 [Ixodes scapularis]|uniref:uncharacterized protein LOC115328245 n=1 Tax=Ixodes scapularis TaxID=6945 RepID=UPI001C38C322|nr:uncharacterized protein LOC115328245 [Ixodes scapularis]
MLTFVFSFSFLRMPPQAFDTLLGLLTERIGKKDTNYRKAISAADRLALTLRFLAAGLTLRMVTFNFLVGRSTACRVVSDVCDALWDILQPVYLTCPQTADEWLRVAADFEERWNFPHSLGAIDGKHVTVECPPKSGSLDRNYKGTFSKSMLAVSDAHYRFLYVELGHHGSESDGGIFSRCKLQERLLQSQMGMPQDQNVGIEGPLPYIVGDEAFPLKTYMMRPFSRKGMPRMRVAYRQINYGPGAQNMPCRKTQPHLQAQTRTQLQPHGRLKYANKGSSTTG